MVAAHANISGDRLVQASAQSVGLYMSKNKLHNFFEQPVPVLNTFLCVFTHKYNTEELSQGSFEDTFVISPIYSIFIWDRTTQQQELKVI